MSDDDDDRSTFEIDFGRVIERERSRRGWTADEAARRADLSPKTWQRLEDGRPVRNSTFLALDELFDLPRGTTLRVWQESGDLQVELDRVLMAGARTRHPQLAARVAAELDQDEDDHAFGVAKAFRRLASTGAPIGFASPVGSDRDLLMAAVGRLGALAHDERGREALKGLVPVAFAGIVNDWDDLFDEEGNLRLSVRSVDDGEH